MKQASSTFEPDHIRRVLGHFATGVTIITTRNLDGRPVGVTANSFNSVSLSPPLVLWSLARNSSSYAAFASAQHWTVHILAEDQAALSSRFASRGTDRFADIETRPGLGNVPLIDGCAAYLQCESVTQYDGGDHTIFIGEVRSFTQQPDTAPLIFHCGKYRRLAVPQCAQSPAGASGVRTVV